MESRIATTMHRIGIVRMLTPLVFALGALGCYRA
jgi:hypothetical protein